MPFARYAIPATLFALLIAKPSFAADPCAGVDRTLTSELRKEYAVLISRSLEVKVKPSKVDIDSIMQAGTWTVVYASTPVADPGYFFFDSSSGKPVFKDVWGGVANKGEAPEIAKWARKLGANKTIASCFANTVAVAE
ncbi:MAG: hypothetical protein J0H18_08600 [Rhizobiales bacterium]|nr:hypothetical protein [Hyphomicrobiales bacterium]OJY03711.1 MAG: hypothetical protein BGP07_07440 [Rhizobiales bacterium 63-22]